MMQQKNEKTPSLREQFNQLSVNDQQIIGHYFNLHNAAGHLFSTLSDAAKEYTELCIKLSMEQNQEEKSE